MRTWLKQNKIYFETISSTLLGLMAIVLSGASIYLANRQIENEEFLNQTRIKVSNEVFAYKGNVNDSHFIVVTNEGGPLTQFDAQMKTFLKIEYYKTPFNVSSDRGVLYIPVLDYFSGQIPIDNFQGTIVKFIGLENLNLLNKLDRGFRIRFAEQHPMTFLSLEHYLETRFINYKGESISKIYRVDFIGGGKEFQIGKRTKEILGQWDPLKGVYLYELTTDDIKKLIETNGIE